MAEECRRNPNSIWLMYWMYVRWGPHGKGEWNDCSTTSLPSLFSFSPNCKCSSEIIHSFSETWWITTHYHWWSEHLSFFKRAFLILEIYFALFSTSILLAAIQLKELDVNPSEPVSKDNLVIWSVVARLPLEIFWYLNQTCTHYCRNYQVRYPRKSGLVNMVSADTK